MLFVGQYIDYVIVRDELHVHQNGWRINVPVIADVNEDQYTRYLRRSNETIITDGKFVDVTWVCPSSGVQYIEQAIERVYWDT
jgi:hypothetical protein